MNLYEQRALELAIERTWHAIESQQWYNAIDYATQLQGAVDVLFMIDAFDVDEYSTLRGIATEWIIFANREIGGRNDDIPSFLKRQAE